MSSRSLTAEVPVGMVPDEPLSRFSRHGGVTVITWCSQDIPRDQVNATIKAQAAALREMADAMEAVCWQGDA